MQLLDRDHTWAVLVGTSQYPGAGGTLSDLPAVENNLRGLHAVLTDPDLANLRPEHCEIVHNPERERDVVAKLHRATETATDTVIVYYAGHGLVDSQNNLHLGLTYSSRQPIVSDALPYNKLRDLLRRRRARSQLVILDCCFSGTAVEGAMSSSEEMAARTAIHGACTLTSCAATEVSLAPPDAHLTTFTGTLLRLLRRGVDGGPAVLDIETIFRLLDWDLRRNSHPQPQLQVENHAAKINLVRNAGGSNPLWRPERRVADPAAPAERVLRDPVVPERSRYCKTCQSPLARPVDHRKPDMAGVCPTCNTPFSFIPELASGDRIGDRYEIVGALAHGGTGWIYLGRELHLADRWCVLKHAHFYGGYPSGIYATPEGHLLRAKLSHPAIMDVRDYVMQGDRTYVVLEYLTGPTVRQIAADHRGTTGRPLPVAKAIPYMLAGLSGVRYLHEEGLLVCDFKPDNLIHTAGTVKLIDLGGLRRMDDQVSAVFGTPGYIAPEVPDTGPSVASDLYTVGRTLAVLTLNWPVNWPAWGRADVAHLPPREDHDVLLRHDSLWEFLQRGCAPDPADRFIDAAQMADALIEVLDDITDTDTET